MVGDGVMGGAEVAVSTTVVLVGATVGMLVLVATAVDVDVLVGIGDAVEVAVETAAALAA